jgi:23S rRNA (uracil1939-C5)-methyltransferase
MKSAEVTTIEKMSHSGHGIAKNGWYILGAYVGDTVRSRPYKTAEGVVYAELLEIIDPSPNRIHTPTQKPFFDPNAPWAHMSFEQENIEKLSILQEFFPNTKIAPHDNLRIDHYRNKVAYSFTLDKNNQISFALYNRGVSGAEKTNYTENILVHEQLNHIGRQFLEFFRQRNTSLNELKYLILRYSYHTDSTVAQILVTEMNKKKLSWKKSDLESFINQHQNLQGILVSHSEPEIRSANITKDFYEIGDIYTIEKMLDKTYQYHPSQFFQIYPDAFSQILSDCEKQLSAIPDHKKYELLDMFSGVGVIGLQLSHLVKNSIGVEQSPLSQQQSIINAERNNVSTVEFIETKAEDATLYIKSNQILVVDPPRSGLTKPVIESILKNRPEYVFYISCSPQTQKRDYDLLTESYDLTWSHGYNLFPKTPHIEHVIVLKKRA